MFVKPVLSISYRRRLLDKCLQAAVLQMQGCVLDVGGKKTNKRGNFRPPKTKQWYTLNLTAKDRPDLIGDAHLLPLDNACVDTLICTEVLEHVADPNQVVAELIRVLRPGGHLILSVPFLVPIHGDPFDFQRFTEQGLRRLLNTHDFQIVSFQAMGLFFTVLIDMLRQPLSKVRPTLLRWCLALPFVLIAAVLLSLERKKRISQVPLIRAYTTGYFVIARQAAEEV